MAEGGKSRSVRWKMVYAVGLSAHLPHHSDSVKGEIILVKRKKVTGRERTGRKCKPTIYCPGIISYPPVFVVGYHFLWNRQLTEHESSSMLG